MPQSTSQSTVLAIAGAAAATGGLNTQKLFLEIIPTWIILPIISFLILYILAKWIFPHLKKQVPNYDFSHLKVHPLLKALLILASLYVAFSIGANNVANAAAPITALLSDLNQPFLQHYLPILIIAPCFALGSSLFGHKLTENTGKKIVSIGPFYALVIALTVASLLLFSSLYHGIPTSLVQLNGAAFIALSVAQIGLKATLKKHIVKRFFLVWCIAPIFSFTLSFFLINLSLNL